MNVTLCIVPSSRKPILLAETLWVSPVCSCFHCPWRANSCIYPHPLDLMFCQTEHLCGHAAVVLRVVWFLFLVSLFMASGAGEKKFNQFIWLIRYLLCILCAIIISIKLVLLRPSSMPAPSAVFGRLASKIRAAACIAKTNLFSNRAANAMAFVFHVQQG